MLLTGTFVRSIDEKMRLAVPKQLREALGTAAEGTLYVTPHTDGSLAIYTEDSLSQVADHLSAASPAGQDVRDFNRLFYARAQRVEIDDQGRIRIPAELSTLAGLGREAVLLGVQDHMELWDKKHWEEYLAKRQQRFDQIAEAAFTARGQV
ncbi:MAG TPA: division/cell wall cluster transcriptional repressor MraZ [Pirellulales bacterium]|jgi:MraZ protein|nr:division/cell wall cluster transcriptional repressor MraZ [Pirellulales bacterium]